jgi:hypothetical protein
MQVRGDWRSGRLELVRTGTLGAAADLFETPAFSTRQEAEFVTGEPAIEGEVASGGTIGRARAAFLTVLAADELQHAGIKLSRVAVEHVVGGARDVEPPHVRQQRLEPVGHREQVSRCLRPRDQQGRYLNAPGIGLA